MFFGGTNQ
jgi:hypothetical protein